MCYAFMYIAFYLGSGKAADRTWSSLWGKLDPYMNTIILMIFTELKCMFFLEMKEMKDIVVTDGRRSSIVFHKNQKKTSRTENTMDVFINLQSIMIITVSLWRQNGRQERNPMWEWKESRATEQNFYEIYEYERRKNQ